MADAVSMAGPASDPAVSTARPWVPVVSLVKGLEQETHRRMTEIVAEVLPGHAAGVLAGPNIAQEVLDGYATAATPAMPDVGSATQWPSCPTPPGSASTPPPTSSGSSCAGR